MSDVIATLLTKERVTVEFVDSLDDAAIVAVLAATVDDTARIIDSTLSDDAVAALERDLAIVGFTGAKDSISRMAHPVEGLDASVTIIGLGSLENSTPTTARLRAAAGTLARSLKKHESFTLDFAGGDKGLAQAALEGAVLGAYEFTAHKSEPKQAKLRTVQLHAPSLSEEDRAEVAGVVDVLTENVILTRDLVNISPLQLYPESFADYAESLATAAGVAVTTLDDAELAAQGFGGLTAVGMGSTRGPRLVRLEHAPKNAEKSIALVGKGITFDSGGISLKPGAGMQEMKSDMAGAATVLSVVLAAARLEIPVRIIGYLALAENLPSGSATRPGDIISMYGGKTVEILNTDAEGRLVMGDALVRASEDEPDVLIDIATLTGAALVALGKRTAAVMGDEATRLSLMDAATSVDEPLWPMPILEEMRPSIDSTQADLSNMGQREGGMLVAAAFLKEFVGSVDGERIPWAHLDIAGPSFNSGGPYGYITKEGTGYGVRTLVEFARGLAD
jgi:leucyl aminopeptidase